MKVKIADAIQTVIAGIIMAAVMFLGSIEAIQAMIYLAVILAIGVGSIAILEWFKDTFAEDDE